MVETIQLGDIAITVTRKDIKHVHLSVHPPAGRVTLVAPAGTPLEVARAYAVATKDAKPSVRLDHRKITLTLRPGSTLAKREEVMQEWHRSLLHEVLPALIRKWETKLGVKVSGYFLQRMKTKWGGCNHRANNIRINTELVKKPKDLLEYVVVHEMVHLIEPKHSERFLALMTEHYPAWREARAELNELPLAADVWRK